MAATVGSTHRRRRQLLGLYFADAGQHLESRLLVDHAVPNCRSNVLYKGRCKGSDSKKPDAHTVWVGDVLIRAEATGTDTFEVNRNLVLTDGARRLGPQPREIETGEIVGAGHASATGRFDDEQLFYLQARGIPEDRPAAVVRGFFNEIISKIAVPAVRDRLTDAIEKNCTRPRPPNRELTQPAHWTSGICTSPSRTPDGTSRGDPQGRQPDGEVGETHAVMGPNGSGKSTLSYAIAGHPEVHRHVWLHHLDGQDVLG